MQSQKHGFDMENEIRKEFGIKIKSNDTKKGIDILACENKLNINISVKSCKINNQICCGDILSFYNRPIIDNYENTKSKIILLQYIQINKEEKKIINIFEINYTKKFIDYLFGNIPIEILKTYINKIKKINNKIDKKTIKNKWDYLLEKNKLQKKYNMKICICPKVNKSQKRVQCAISNSLFVILCNTCYVIKKINKYNIKKIYKSRQRNFGGLTVFNLKKYCRHKKITGYSKFIKEKLINYIIKKLNIKTKKELLDKITTMNSQS